MRVLAYVRVSTDAQAESGYSLPEQERLLREYAARHGHTLVGLVADDGVSGRMLQRPAVREVLTRADAGTFDALLCLELGRLGRANRVVQELIYRLKTKRIATLFAQHASPDTPANRLLNNVLGGVSEYELEQIRLRTMAGRAQKARQGRIPARCEPYGYRQIRVDEARVLPQYAGRDGELEINEPEAALVRELFRRFAEGASLHGLARWLNDERQVPTRRGNRWRPDSVRRLLELEAYAGTLRWGKRECFIEYDEEDQKLLLRSPRARDEQIPIPVQALVPRELWEQVQTRLRFTQATQAGRPTETYLLRGCLVCAVCRRKDGTPFRCHGVRKSHNRERAGYVERAYVCDSDKYRNERNEREYCGCRWPAERLETLALNALQDALRPGRLADLLEAQATAAAVDSGATAAQEAHLAAALAEVEGKLERAADALLDGRFPADLLERRITPLRAERERLLGELAAVRARRQTPDLTAIRARADERAARHLASLEAAGWSLIALRSSYQDLFLIRLHPRKARKGPEFHLRP